jgi:hypothetical protein
MKGLIIGIGLGIALTKSTRVAELLREGTRRLDAFALDLEEKIGEAERKAREGNPLVSLKDEVERLLSKGSGGVDFETLVRRARENIGLTDDACCGGACGGQEDSGDEPQPDKADTPRYSGEKYADEETGGLGG